MGLASSTAILDDDKVVQEKTEEEELAPLNLAPIREILEAWPELPIFITFDFRTGWVPPRTDLRKLAEYVSPLLRELTRGRIKESFADFTEDTEGLVWRLMRVYSLSAAEDKVET